MDNPSFIDPLGNLFRAKNQITGQLFFRDADVADQLLPGSNNIIMMVLGLIAVNAETKLKGEHQYSISCVEHAGIIEGHIHLRTATDRSDISIGNSPSGILTSPIWRV